MSVLAQARIKYDLFDPRLFEDPYPLYNQMREEDPVYWCEPLQGWLVTRHEDCARVLKDVEHFSAERMQRLLALQFPQVSAESCPYAVGFYTQAMLFLDGADHFRQRGYVNRAFVPRALEVYQGMVEATVAQLLEAVLARGSMDFHTQFAEPLPAIVISRIIGVSAEDWPRFRQWTEHTALFFSGAVRTDNDVRATEEATRDFLAYIDRALAERRHQPGEDMLSYMIAGSDMGRFLPRELRTQVLMLITAGHATTLDLLGNGMLALLRHPQQLQRLREHPVLLSNAVDEVLRYVSPVQITHRVVKQGVELRGQRLRQGDMVYVVLAAANRDPRVFRDPDRLDVGRESTWGLGVEPTTAWARTWRAWRRRWPSARCCGTCRGCAWRASPGGVGRGSCSGAWPRCRWRGEQAAGSACLRGGRALVQSPWPSHCPKHSSAPSERASPPTSPPGSRVSSRSTGATGRRCTPRRRAWCAFRAPRRRWRGCSGCATSTTCRWCPREAARGWRAGRWRPGARWCSPCGA
jgi:cytochrome P450